MKVIREAYRAGESWPHFVTLERGEDVQGYYRVDRDALLTLADEIARHADMAAGHVAYAARFDFSGWAARIREALGVEQ